MNVTDQGTLFKWALSGLGNKQTRVIDRLNSNSSTTSQPSADRRASLKSPSVVKRAKSKKTTAENAPEADSRAEGKQDVSRKSLPHAATFQNGVPLELDVGTNVFLSSSGNEQQTANSTNLLRTPPSTASGDLIDGTAVFLAPASLSPTHKRAQSDLSLFNEADDNGEQVPKSSAVRLLSQCSGNMSRSACCSDQSSLSDEWPAGTKPQPIHLVTQPSESSVEKPSDNKDLPNNWRAPGHRIVSPDSLHSSPSPSLNGAPAQNAADGRTPSPNPMHAPTGSSSAEALDPQSKKAKVIPAIKPTWRPIITKPYAQRDAEFRKNFGNLMATNDRYITEYSCAYLGDRYLVQQGKLYVTQRMILFSSRMFRTVKQPKPMLFSDVEDVKKERTIRLIHPALRIVLNDGRSFFFSPLSCSRKDTQNLLKRLVDAAYSKQPLTNVDLWTLVHSLHGSELGFASSREQSGRRNTSNTTANTNATAGCSSITDYPDYLEYLTTVTRNSNAVKQTAVNSDALASSSQSSSDKAALNESTAVHKSEVLFDSGSMDDDGTDADDETDGDTSVDRASYLSLTDIRSPDTPCCGHSALEIIGVRRIFNLSINFVYDALVNMDSNVARNLYDMQKAKILNLEEWQVMEPSETDKQLLPTRPELQRSVELIKLQRSMVYTTPVNLIITALVTNDEYQTLLLKRSASDPSRLHSAMIISRVDPSGIALAKNSHFHRQFCLHRLPGDTQRCQLIASHQFTFKNGFQKQAMLPQLNSRTERYYKQMSELLIEAEQDFARRRQAQPEQPLSSYTNSSSESSQPFSEVPHDMHLRRRDVSSNDARSAEQETDTNATTAIATATATVQSYKQKPEVVHHAADNDAFAIVSKKQQSALSSVSHVPSDVRHTGSSLVTTISHYIFLFLVIFLLFFVVWSQMTLHSRLESIEQLLQELLATSDDGNTPNLRATNAHVLVNSNAVHGDQTPLTHQS